MNDVSIPYISIIISFIVAFFYIEKYFSSLPKISFEAKFDYAYELQLDLLNGKMISIFIYSDRENLRLKQFLLDPRCCESSYSIFDGDILCISSPNAIYRIPEKQILSKKLIKVTDDEALK